MMVSSRNTEHLFNRGRLSDALRAQIDSVPQRIQKIAESVIRAREDNDLADQVIEDLRVCPLILDRAAQTMTREEVQVDVTGDPMRMGFPDGRRIIVPGVRVIVSIPYRGDEMLWHLVPSTYRLSAPIGSVRRGHGKDEGMLLLPIEQPTDQPLERIKAELDSRLGDINFFIDSQRRDLAGFEQELRHSILSEIAQRRARLGKHDGLSSLLGIPEASSTPRTNASRETAATITFGSSPTSPSEAEAWDVFVSHASEDKESLVRPLVAGLVAAGLKVWYDEATLRVGDSLRQSIDRGLAKSRFGVVVLSKAFFAKHWPQRELDGLVALEEVGKKVVLPVWHEITPTEVRRFSPTLADRLAVNSVRGITSVVEELLKAIRNS